MNVMRTIKIEKLTLNVGAGKDQKVLARGVKLLKHISGTEPVKTITNKRIPAWGLRKGLPIGCKLTLRGKEAQELLKRLLEAKEGVLKAKQFDGNGNLAFGVPEYIDVPGAEYDPELGMMGFEVCVTLGRPGFRVKRRRLQRAKVHGKHHIGKEDAIAFMQENFGIKVE